MRWLIAIGLVMAFGAERALAATPAEVLCASYKNALAKETDRAKREAMIKSLPHGCEVKATPPPPARKPAEPVRAPVQAAPRPAPAPAPVPAPEPVAAPEPPPPPMPAAGPPLPAGVSAEDANANGNKAYQGKKYAEAMKWFRMSADQGNAVAMNDIGELYFNGHGVNVDYREAIAWYRRAAARGNATAQESIGALYARGQGVEIYNAEAMRWFRKSAAQGNADAANWLGFFYSHGV
ncbi:MAG TPA: tetratricopeptide repeat protein, partial [Caulobacteraceae bacterium]